MLTIYVDDLMLSGPEDAHDSFWKLLSEDVHLEDPEPLDRFLGRHHEYIVCEPPDVDNREFFTPNQINDEEQVLHENDL